MRSVVVTGSAGPVGRRLVAALGPAAVTLDLAAASDQDLDAALARAEVVAHLDWTLAGPRVAEQAARANVESTRRLLAAAGRRSVDVLVLLSSATVYGAWRDNPIPLTEEAPLRPNPGVVDAVHHAEAERLVTEWADDHPAARVVILRPAMVLGPGIDTWLTRALGGRPAVRPDQADPPRQFVHVDDVAGAVLAAIEGPLVGTFNVAADGWLTGEAVRGLSAGRPTVPIPGRLASDTARWAWDLHLSDMPPWVMPLVEHPWVVANDRLRAAGWEPRYTNEEAVVAGRPGSWWREMSPARRQQVTLAASAGALAALGAGVAAVVGAARRR